MRGKRLFSVKDVAAWATCTERLVYTAIDELGIPYADGRPVVLEDENGNTCTSRPGLTQEDVHAILQRIYSHKPVSGNPRWRRKFVRRHEGVRWKDLNSREQQKLLQQLSGSCAKLPKKA